MQSVSVSQARQQIEQAQQRARQVIHASRKYLEYMRDVFEGRARPRHELTVESIKMAKERRHPSPTQQLSSNDGTVPAESSGATEGGTSGGSGGSGDDGGDDGDPDSDRPRPRSARSPRQACTSCGSTQRSTSVSASRSRHRNKTSMARKPKPDYVRARRRDWMIYSIVILILVLSVYFAERGHVDLAKTTLSLLPGPVIVRLFSPN